VPRVLKVAVVVGARPNFVKAAALLGEVRNYPEVQAQLIHTGQHYDHRMSGQFFAELEIPTPDVNLGVRSDSPVEQTAEIMVRLTGHLSSNRPDVVVVVGDVTSTLAAALVANKLSLRLVHVEAGLRSFDRTMPEEINRVLTDALADYCFTTEPAANENLLREGVSPERIRYVGNVMIDTLFRFRELASLSTILDRLAVRARHYAVLTLHRPGNVDSPEALARNLSAVAPVLDDVPMIFPVHPRTMSRLAQLGELVPRGLRVIEPLAYLDFVQLMANSACVLTDSGGIQEETTALGIPCLTLRANTERPITVTHGTNRLVGLDGGQLSAAWQQICRGQWPMGRLPELWDGKAAQRIVRALLDLEDR
jgi:UDP-N-acetylglucosamine 2-epimerase (non-hydrolysing)